MQILIWVMMIVGGAAGLLSTAYLFGYADKFWCGRFSAR